MKTYGKVTLAKGHPEERKVNIAALMQLDFEDGRKCIVAELAENNGYLLEVKNPSDSDRLPSTAMWLTKESFIGLVTTASLFMSSVFDDPHKELLKAIGSDKVFYTVTDNINPPAHD